MSQHDRERLQMFSVARAASAQRAEGGGCEDAGVCPNCGTPRVFKIAPARLAVVKETLLPGELSIDAIAAECPSCGHRWFNMRELNSLSDDIQIKAMIAFGRQTRDSVMEAVHAIHLGRQHIVAVLAALGLVALAGAVIRDGWSAVFCWLIWLAAWLLAMHQRRRITNAEVIAWWKAKGVEQRALEEVGDRE